MKNYVAAAALISLSLCSAGPARADSTGAAIAAGVGGAAIGAMLGGALAQPGPPVYAPPPAPVYVERPHCWRERRPVFDEYGEIIGYRPIRICD
jgi:hypothetical protein